MAMNLDSTTEMDYQNATLPKSGNSTPERPFRPTSCARLEATKADICRYTLIAQGFENMIPPSANQTHKMNTIRPLWKS
ncbi:hypothetical protein TNIN_406191 [Trichonephila inaurata madagascariensis]|uniref:Uncharacterized protein n=1 Tax=Trichonephila inaurata madagascariensis TaxID=2747483 RepID=A0A8X6M8F7_9ARAC|nr:hypothetical protein TNIN_406191 [Trichonephila inaurata madagascariensis]